MATKSKAPTGDKVKVDLAVSAESFQHALTRCAEVEQVDVPNVTLKLTANGFDDLRFSSLDGAFELVLRVDGTWNAIYHTTINSGSVS